MINKALLAWVANRMLIDQPKHNISNLLPS